ncbi:MAG: quinoprotein dehydrogenase-associated SoxYZ-like carrier [Methylophaga sp.]|nr:MAG: quinoprotein dehydrogenase-associated SoxYZ-like carrier [Methylophaga sp.]
MLYITNIFIMSVVLVVVAMPAYAEPYTELWPLLKIEYFGDKTIREDADDLLVLEAPKRAEDAAIVPITIKSLVPQTADKYIKNIHIIIDSNPEPYSANFTLSANLALIDISTRMRVDRYTYVRAIAEMNDGSLHMVSRFVKASGGCSAPPSKDAESALARLGKMQIRMRKPIIGKLVTAQVIISHPNFSGLQFDQITRGYFPEYRVTKIDIAYNDEILISVETGISVSEDPSIRFTFTPAEPGILKVDVTDSKNQQFSHTKEI